MVAEISDRAGYGNSLIGTFTIAEAADGSAVTPVDLDRNYAFLAIRCTDISNVATPATDTAAVYVEPADAADAMLIVRDDVGSLSLALDVAFQRTIFVGAARHVRLVLSAVASGGSVVFQIYGIDAAVAR